MVHVEVVAPGIDIADLRLGMRQEGIEADPPRRLTRRPGARTMGGTANESILGSNSELVYSLATTAAVTGFTRVLIAHIKNSRTKFTIKVDKTVVTVDSRSSDLPQTLEILRGALNAPPATQAPVELDPGSGNVG